MKTFLATLILLLAGHSAVAATTWNIHDIKYNLKFQLIDANGILIKEGSIPNVGAKTISSEDESNCAFYNANAHYAQCQIKSVDWDASGSLELGDSYRFDQDIVVPSKFILDSLASLKMGDTQTNNEIFSKNYAQKNYYYRIDGAENDALFFGNVNQSIVLKAAKNFLKISYEIVEFSSSTRSW